MPMPLMFQLLQEEIGAQATAYQLSGGALNIITIQITRQLRGDVANDQGVGYAMAMGMVVVMAISIAAYSLLQRRSERWIR